MRSPHESFPVSAEAVTPQKILETGFAFWPSKVLLTAVELDVFTMLGSRSMTPAELGGVLDLHPRGILDFFDALVALGFLERDGDGPLARYRNTPATARYLDRTQPGYIGGMLEMLNARLFGFWNDLGAALKTGEPQNELKHNLAPMFETLYSDPARLEQFMCAIRGISASNFQELAEKVDCTTYNTLCDVGGATGLLSSLVAKRHSHLKCLSFDLPEVEPIARRWIQNDGMSDRVTAVSGNFLKDPLPRADVITMGMILHDWNLDRKKHLVRLAYDALPPGGAFIAVENIIDDARRENAFGLMMSLNMLIEFGDAFDFTGADFWSWCREAGFERYEVVHLAGPCSAAIAYKHERPPALTALCRANCIGKGIYYTQNGIGPNNWIVADNDIGSVTYVDARLSWEMTFGESDIELFGNVSNLFDRDPPIAAIYDPSVARPLQYTGVLYDVLGKRIAVGVNVRFWSGYKWVDAGHSGDAPHAVPATHAGARTLIASSGRARCPEISLLFGGSTARSVRPGADARCIMATDGEEKEGAAPASGSDISASARRAASISAQAPRPVRSRRCAQGKSSGGIRPDTGLR